MVASVDSCSYKRQHLSPERGLSRIRTSLLSLLGLILGHAVADTRFSDYADRIGCIVAQLAAEPFYNLPYQPRLAFLFLSPHL